MPGGKNKTLSFQNIQKRLRWLENKYNQLNTIINNGGGASYTDTYSTTEFETNKDFLGKPVFRKVVEFNGNTLRNVDFGVITHNLNIDQYLDVKVISKLKNTDNHVVFTPPELQNRAASPNIGGLANFNTNDILFETWNTNGIGGQDWYLILEYTKN